MFDFDYIKGDVPNTFYWYTNTRTIISLDSSAILLILNPYEHDENNTLLKNWRAWWNKSTPKHSESWSWILLSCKICKSESFSVLGISTLISELKDGGPSKYIPSTILSKIQIFCIGNWHNNRIIIFLLPNLIAKKKKKL